MTGRTLSTAATEVREKDLQKHVRTFAKQMGWKEHVTWLSMLSPRGWPDLTLYRQRSDGVGELVCIELKTEKGKTTPYQDEWLAALATVPGVKWCGVVRPSGWFAGVLDDVLR